MPSSKSFKTSIDLRTFLTAVENRLNALTRDELHALLLEYARQLDSRDRAEFLAMLQASVPRPSVVNREVGDDPSLLEEIETFAEDVENGRYYDGWEWDEELGDERAFGDESWVEEMDALFDRAAAQFLAGNRGLATLAYRQLFHAFEIGEDVGTYSGAFPPYEMVETDLDEAKARYFRGVYETSPAKKRIEALLEEMMELSQYGNSHVGLLAMLNADTSELPDFEKFLAEWIAELKHRTPGNEYGESIWGQQLREAVVLADGIEGLTQLARESGDRHPQVYHDLVVTLAKDGKIDQAIDAAREGILRIKHNGERARLADALAVLAARGDDAMLAVVSRREAWRSSPTLLRLRRLCDEGTPDAQELETRLRDELTDLQRGLYHIKPSLPGRNAEDEGLNILLQLLCGEYETPLQRVQKADRLGWSQPGHPGPIVYPYLLLAAAGSTQSPPAGSVLADWLADLDQAADRYHPEVSPLLPDSGEYTVKTAGELLLESLVRHPIDPDTRNAFFTIAMLVARKRIDAIVSNTHRGAYERAARLIVAYAEALVLADRKSEAMPILTGIRDAYPRHRAFRGELEALVVRTPLLQRMPGR